MGTPFITFLEPSKLEGYMRGAPRDSQPPSIPSAFLDAMEVRERVFVEEQGVNPESEFDDDDSRSCHWVVYASVNKTEELEVRDEEGNVVQPRKSTTRSTPIGTIRLVPFPHDAHPQPGGRYYNGQLEGEAPSEKTSTGYITDRETTFHDGKEPYVKLGRLAVIPEFRGHRVAGLLVNTVLGWLRNNPSYFDPSIKEMGLEQLGAKNEMDIPKWNGLICIHAQEKVIGAWAKWGFKTDEAMGKWWEEGIPHVGMFQRIETNPKQVLI
ncbi:hypothetical protein NLU13_3366 [Sarocladium strictum]|uniref:Uncharacterized protein n=1 Tax=Sarocladium strictum TaxID=5046 RepID=A0AA39LA83_SARSR|nr:hypothetical protein NLU13_3366 [Sarocladium strictum]